LEAIGPRKRQERKMPMPLREERRDGPPSVFPG
jgi:hypothetical protein